MAGVSGCKKHKTRLLTNCPIFGNPSYLPETVLPTNADVMKYYLFLKDEMAYRSADIPSVAEVSSCVSSKVEALWYKASIPIITHERIVAKIKELHDKH